jgi:hypothetical protein
MEFPTPLYSSSVAIAQALAKFQRDESGALRLIATSGGGGPNATFTITRVDNIPNGDMIAPFPAWFRATSLSGFAYSEPGGSTNVYDPTQHRIRFIWSFGDPGYVPARVPNIPTVWRDYNVAYGRQVCHVFNTAGDYTVTCFAFDDAGNWGTATHTFQAGGDSPAIIAPDSFFSTNKTICFSRDNNFTGAPSGATQCTTEAAVRSAIDTRISAGDTLLRVLLRRGETYNNMEWINVRDAGRGIHWGAYGTGARPIIDQTTLSGPFGYRDTTRHCVISEIDWRGPYDATKETGRRLRLFASQLDSYGSQMLVHRCRFTGYDSGSFENTNIANGLVFHDVEYTNWRDFGLLIYRPTRLAMIGCDGYQHVDALNGINHESSNTNSKLLGNGHGPVRIIVRAPQMYIACSSFFSRNGWSAGDPVDAINFPPTAAQPAFRDAPEDIVTERCYRVHDRNSYEGGDDIVRMLTPAGSSSVETPTQHRNTVFDKCLFAATPQSFEAINNSFLGMTVRNCYVWVPSRTWARSVAARGPSFVAPFKTDYVGTFDAGQTGPIEVYNNTVIIEANNTQLGATTRNITQFSGTWTSTVENNVFVGLNLSPAVGATFSPLGSTQLSGFTPRYKGQRWNFPPIGSTIMGGQIDVTSVREGGAGTVNVGEWVSFPYPNYNTRCAGAGNALNPATQALVTGNSGQYHQVSVTTFGDGYGGKAMAPAAAGGDGRVVFDFTPSAIRIQNNSGSPWSSGQIWVMLDLSGFHMGHVTSGDTTGLTVPNPIPGSGSAALNGYSTGLRAREDFFGAVRSGERLTNGAIVSGTDELGAIRVA